LSKNILEQFIPKRPLAVQHGIDFIDIKVRIERSNHPSNKGVSKKVAFRHCDCEERSRKQSRISLNQGITSSSILEKIPISGFLDIFINRKCIRLIPRLHII
jgi:hypothetical protein